MMAHVEIDEGLEKVEPPWMVDGIHDTTTRCLMCTQDPVCKSVDEQQSVVGN